MKKKVFILAIILVFWGCVIFSYKNRADSSENPLPRIPVINGELLSSSKEGYHSVEIYGQGNTVVINAESESAFFDGIQLTVETQGKIKPEDIEIIWKTIGGGTEQTEDNDLVIAEIRITENGELIFHRKINFLGKAVEILDDYLEEQFKNVSRRQEAEEDCIKVMELIGSIYVRADKGDASNVVLSDEVMLKMQERLKETERPVVAGVTYSNMENYECMDNFLRECLDGESGSEVIYDIHSNGGIGRMEFIYDGTDMYLLSMNAAWDEENTPKVTYESCNRIKQWKYTDKGWLCYELCVPEPPKVTEIIDGSHMIRVSPMSGVNREASEKYVFGLGYQGNNLLCSNWDTEHLKDIDYNGLYEYLYAMKYQEKYNDGDDPDGIPGDEFEGLIMEYLPVTTEQIREYAVFDKERQTYGWARLGCFNYAPTFFGTSLPEVTGIRENGDGTITLTVDAVCEMMLCDDAVITHELTIQVKEDGGFRYLSNRILNDGIQNIPEYQYRFMEVRH